MDNNKEKEKFRVHLTYDQFVNLSWEEIEQLPEYQRKLEAIK